jgi:nucleoside-diphosphate kinase
VQRTLLIVKPDAVQRGLVGRITERLESKGLKLVGLRLIRMTRSLAERLYAVHLGKPFYEPLVEFITSGPVVLVVVEGKEAIAVARKLIGATACAAAEPGTIRGDLGVSNRFNLVHGSDAPESAAREIAIFFRPEDLVEWTPAAWPWIYDFSAGEPI